MLAAITQILDPTDDPSGVLGHYWPLVAVALPLFVAYATRYTSAQYVKRGIAAVFAVLAVIVSLWGMAWDDITLALIVQRLTAEAVIAEVTFRTAELLVQKATGEGLGALGIFAPSRGVGAGTRQENT